MGVVITVVVAVTVVAVTVGTQVLHIPLHINFSRLPKSGSSQNSGVNKGESHEAGSSRPLHENASFVVGAAVVMGGGVVSSHVRQSTGQKDRA